MKRFLAVLLCLLMCVSMLPAYAFAETAELELDDQELELLKVNQIEEHQHALIPVPAREAVFYPGNAAYYKCSVCGELFEDVNAEIPTTENDVYLKPAHTKPTDQSKLKVTPATCTRNGKIEYTCADEGCNVKGADVIAAHGTACYYEPNEPTCTSQGNTAYYRCSKCWAFYADQDATQPISAESTVVAPLGHNLVAVLAKAATCAEEGNQEYWKCSRCGAVFEDEQGTVPTDLQNVTIQKTTNHQLTKHDAVQESCAHAGNIEYWECSVCGKLFSDAEGNTETTGAAVAKPALQHTLTKTEATAVTCSSEGNTDYWTCSICNKIFSDANGVNEIQKADTVLAAGHDLEKTEAVAATCTKDGTREYWTCKREGCGKIFADGEGKTELQMAELTVKSTGHHFEGGVCKACGEIDKTFKASVKSGNLNIGEGEGFSITLDADFDTVTAEEWHLYLDGKEIDKEHITVSRGSVIFSINFDEDPGLTPGKHQVKVETAQGVVSATLTVSQSFNVNTPKLENGSVSANKTTATEGETITLTVTPDKGYKLDKLSVVDADKNNLTVTSNQFTMPAKDVTVTATFKRIYNVAVSSSEHGSVSADKSAADVDETVKLTVTPDYNYIRDSVKVVDNTTKKQIAVKDNQFTMPASDVTVSATFKRLKIIYGNGGTAHYGSHYSFALNSPFAEVERIEVRDANGKMMLEPLYDSNPAKGIVTLRRSYIKSLYVGTYDIAIVTDLGIAYGTFRVSSSPKTGDDSNVALWVTVGVISAAGVAGIAYYLLKKRKK